MGGHNLDATHIAANLAGQIVQQSGQHAIGKGLSTGGLGEAAGVALHGLTAAGSNVVCQLPRDHIDGHQVAVALGSAKSTQQPKGRGKNDLAGYKGELFPNNPDRIGKENFIKIKGESVFESKNDGTI